MSATPARCRFYLATPALLAVIPILYRQVRNPWPAVEDAITFAAALAAAVVLAQLAAYGALRALAGCPRAAEMWGTALGAAGVVLFYGWPPTSDAAHALANRHPHLLAPATVVALPPLAGTLWWSARRGGAARAAPALPAITHVAAFPAALLATWLAAQVAATPVRLAYAVRHSAALRDLARPVPVTRPAVSGPPRDVYLVVLDAYPAAHALREVYGIDNTPFLDSLRALGFHIPVQLRSNYPFTAASLPSFLNFAQLDPLARDLPLGTPTYALAGHLAEHNRAARFLKDRGYRTVFFPSVWFPLTRHNRDADAEVRDPPGFDLARAVWRSPLVSSFAEETLLRRLLRGFPTRQDVITAHLNGTFAGLAALAARPAGGPPVYAFAHLLIPHPDFAADASCRPYPRGTTLSSDRPPASPLVRARLAAYLACANRQVLATARAVLARPGPRPIIVLVGDHGTAGLRFFDTPRVALTPAQVRERYSPFGAFYLPDGGAAAMPDSTSLVNVLRTVFRTYHGADLPPLPNAMYLVAGSGPFRTTPIDTLSLRPITRFINSAVPTAPH